MALSLRVNLEPVESHAVSQNSEVMKAERTISQQKKHHPYYLLIILLLIGLDLTGSVHHLLGPRPAAIINPDQLIC